MRNFGKSLSTVLALACVAIAGIAAAPAAAKPSRCPGAQLHPSQLDPGNYAEVIHCLLNHKRRSNGLKPLRNRDPLTGAALSHSFSMRDLSYFEHEDPDGSTPTSRIRSTGYLKKTRSWMIGENIAWGQGSRGTPANIVDAWMHSPEHRANILTGRFREIGIGVTYGCPERINLSDVAIVTTDFGRVKRFGRAGR